MLSIMLGLLKIIGIILLTLLGIILLILLVLLIVPVRYNAQASVCGFDDTEADVRASWLLKLVRLRYIRKAGEDELRFYIFWFFRLRIEDKLLDDKVSDDKVFDEKIFDDNDAPVKETDAPVKATAADTKKEGLFGRIKGIGKQLKGIADKIKGASEQIKNMAEQINYYRNYPDRNAIIAATWGLIKKLFKKLKPKKLRISGEVGLKSPHITAYLFGVAGALQAPVSGINPNFDEQTINLNIYARGKLSLWDLLWPLFRYSIKRPIWPLTKKIIFRKGDADE